MPAKSTPPAKATVPARDLYVPFSDDPNAALAWSGPQLGHELQVWRHIRPRPDGTTGTYYRVKMTTEHPGVIVLPVNEDGAIGLLKAWRPAVDEWVWETPRGFGESPDPIEDAARELAEETGLSAVDLIYAGRLFSDTGLLANPVHIVIACVEAVTGAASAPQDGAEDAYELRGFTFFDRRAVRQMILNGDIVDAATLSAIARLDAALG